MTGFAWLNDLMVWIGKLFPRLTLVKSTEKGVLFSRGGRQKLIEPGLFLFWPIVQDLHTTSTLRRTMEICSQLVNGESISIVVFWRIVDVFAALTLVHQIPSNLDDTAQGALSECCSEGRQTNQELCASVLKLLNKKLSPLGYEILEIGIVHRGPVISLRHFKDWACHESNEHQ